MLDKLYAHIDNKDRGKKQSLYSHLLNTGLEGKKLGKKVDMENICFLTGLLHDIGKASLDFQEKIIKNSNKMVDHSSLGGLFVFKIYRDLLSDLNKSSNSNILKLKESMTADNNLIFELSDYTNILIYTLMSHHSQYDMVRKNKDMIYVMTSFDRMEKLENSSYRFGVNHDDSLGIDEFYIEVEKFFESKEIYIKEIFCQGFFDYIEIIKKLKEASSAYSSKEYAQALYFYKSILTRLLVSILKSADIRTQ